MKKSILLITLIMSSYMFVKAGDHQFTIGEKVSFKSEVLNEERKIIVYVPKSYNFTDREYPVLYLLDGGFHFHHASGIAQFLASSGLAPEMIVVAVVNTDRNKDFTPTHLEQRATSGGAEKFTLFFADELIPFIERNYRSGSYKTLMGHSLGGTFATYVLLNKPELFNSYISISPYLMYDNNLMVRETEKKLKEKYKDGTVYYMTVGDEPNYFEALDYVAKTIMTKEPKGLKFEYTQMLDDDHGSVPHLSIYNGLLYIYSGWKLKPEVFNEGIAAIDMHYKNISKNFGYEINTPEMTINRLGYTYLASSDFNNAIAVFTENVKRFPKSSNVYDSLGEAYEKNGQIEKAKVNYAKAVEIAEKEKHPNLKIYKQNLERVQEES